MGEYTSEDHINKLTAMALAGDETSIRSLACMVLLIDRNPPTGGGERDGVVVQLDKWRKSA